MRYSSSYHVLIDQVDESSHLSNVQYYHFFKNAVFAFLHEHKFTELNQPDDLWPVVLKESCEFHREVLFNQLINVDIYFSDFGKNKNKYLCNGIMSDENNEILAEWKSFHGILNRSTRKISPMTEQAFNLLKQFSEV